jgi:hypothetical protein
MPQISNPNLICSAETKRNINPLSILKSMGRIYTPNWIKLPSDYTSCAEMFKQPGYTCSPETAQLSDTEPGRKEKRS